MFREDAERIAVLNEQMAQVADQCQRIENRAKAEGRELSTEERAEVDGMVAKFNALDADAKRVQLLSRPQPRMTQPGDLPGLSARGAMGGPGRVGRVAQSPHVQALGEFAKTGRIMGAMTIGTPSEGGYSVPVEVDQEIMTIAAAYSPVLKIARVKEGVTDAYVQNVATGLPATGWVAETGTRSVTATPAFAQVTFPRGGLYANASATSWLLEDNVHELGEWLVGEIGRAQGVAMGAAFANGTGTSQPLGLTAHTFAATADGARAFGTLEYMASGTSAGGISIDKCVDLFFKLAAEYRQPGRCSWVMSPAALAVLRKEKASTAGSYMWEPSSQDGQPSKLLGMPVYEDTNLSVGAASYSIFVGDFQRGYTCVLYGTPVLIRDPYTSKGSTLFYLERRVGGRATDTNAIKALKLSAS
jgi:HK97 family phage major capsid protein